MKLAKILSPDDPALDALVAKLAEISVELDRAPAWPIESLRLCARAGVFEWFAPAEFGGQQWAEPDLLRGYVRLSAACLTTAFVITQWAAAIQRLVASGNAELKGRLLPDLVAGKTFATVGISHLTTSRRHLAKPVMQAAALNDGYVLNGYSPWVTGGLHADTLILGATLDDARQILVAVDRRSPGVEALPAAQLQALGGSQTGQVNLGETFIPRDCLLAPPAENVLSTLSSGGAGGLATSALAIGLADAAIRFLEAEASKRPDLAVPAAGLRTDQSRLEKDLLQLASGLNPCSGEQLRSRSNSLALRASQASLAAAKGAGFIVGHPAGRWCREALFFLVWSCPQPVLAANLCELAGLGE